MRYDECHSLGQDLYSQMCEMGFILPGNQFKTGRFMNDDGKRLYIKQIKPKSSPAGTNVTVYIQYAHVVSVYGHPSTDPGVILGFDHEKRCVYPVLYRNDLLDHSIHMYKHGQLNEDQADWLLKFCSDWFTQLDADDYDNMEIEPQSSTRTKRTQADAASSQTVSITS
jgi:hypothetical protein